MGDSEKGGTSHERLGRGEASDRHRPAAAALSREREHLNAPVWLTVTPRQKDQPPGVC
jgi:hypothetical protein